MAPNRTQQTVPPDEPLGADIRRGAFDDAAAKLDKVKAHLLETTLQKLRENNPRYLEAEGFE